MRECIIRLAGGHTPRCARERTAARRGGSDKLWKKSNQRKEKWKRELEEADKGRGSEQEGRIITS